MRPFLLALATFAGLVLAPAAAFAQWGGTPGWAVTTPGYHPLRSARHHRSHKLRHRVAHRYHAASVVARTRAERTDDVPPSAGRAYIPPVATDVPQGRP